MDDIFQSLFFAPKILGVLRIVPDGWIFEFCVYNLETFEFDVVVKDTPVRRLVVRCSLPGAL